MKFISKYSFLLVALSLFFACSEDLLEPKPLSFYAPENVFVDQAGYEAALVTMRKALTEGLTGSRRYYMVGEWAASEAGNPTFQLDWFQTTPFFDRYYTFLPLFSESFEFIKNANVLIGRIDDIEWNDEAAKNRILAEGYWHRAYWYYWLVNAYGDVPFVGEEVNQVKLDYYTHSRWAILDKIQEDMEFASQWLPETAIPGAISKGAADHLLTKIYLANLEFDKAIESSSRVINGNYALMEDRFGTSAEDAKRNVIWDLHRPENKNISQNTETILAMVDRFEAPAGAQSAGLYTMRHYNCSWWHSTLRDSEGIRGVLDSGPMYDSLGRGNPDLVITPYAYKDIWDEGGMEWHNTPDLRRSDLNWVDKHELVYNNPESVDFGKPVNPMFLTDPQDSVYKHFPIPFYKTYAPQQSPTAVPMGGNGDWYIFRLAETYLLRAEAYFWKNQLDLAAADINTVRNRAQAIPVEASEVTIDYIFDERARELFLESPRHSELVRVSYIMAAQNLGGYSLETFAESNWWYDRVTDKNIMYTIKPVIIGNTPEVAPFHVLWPIDNNVITANTLGVINQNEGYVGAENNVAPLETIE
ncbi:RagB/SusD family nutrient uptake outer membrane protein [Cyclobacterium jeungdonense]|uniref:RagB/SusD family nutrient uptake outer membrane protein n=1 Tax=Cyclobacterium jeungdonense TaxID=708087 RepID=A0ABT8C854_9BACT|nr:RagB/SusD family nutrient uptake outer membrane protein [Cyclobacterium jeungdonense]MDN3688960.1 RagB/SusD family nutrient uptake outer membrane protein [Cyclobacterium jeungdonense]